MAKQKLILGWSDGEEIEVILEGDMLKCKRVCDLFTTNEANAVFSHSFVVLSCSEFPGGEPRTFVFNTCYTEDELMHMQRALQLITGDEP